MKYLITRRAVRSDVTITITRSEFLALKEARYILFAGLDIEQQYELLLSNYEDFEKEIVSVAIERMLYAVSEFRQYHARLNKRIINLLTTSRLYKDQVKLRVGDIIKNGSDGIDKVNAMFIERENKHIEYRFMEQLRNHVQHFSLPVSQMSFDGWVENWTKTSWELPSTIEFAADKKSIQKDPRFNKEVIVELEDTVDLKKMTRKYVECLSEIQAGIRSMILGKLSEARDLIEECINRYNEKVDEKTSHVIVVAFEEGREDKEQVYLSLSSDDIRLEIAKKNKILTNLSSQYVTGQKRGIKKVM